MAIVSAFRRAPGDQWLAAHRKHPLWRLRVYQFYQAIEQAKIALSSVQSTVIEFHRPGIDVSMPMCRYEFEHMAAAPNGVGPR